MGRAIIRTHNTQTHRFDGSRALPIIKSPPLDGIGKIRTLFRLISLGNILYKVVYRIILKA